jgi:putative heme-binding domain-containing protein
MICRRERQLICGRQTTLLLGAVAAFTALCLVILPRLDPARAQESLQERKPLPKFLRSATLAERYLGTRDVSEVMTFERVEPVCLQLVKRPGVPAHVRSEALQKLAELRNTDGTTELLPWIRHWSQLADAAAEVAAAEEATSTLLELSELLAEQPREDLRKHRAELELLAREAIRPAARQGALVGLIRADGNPDAAWKLGDEQPSLRLDFVQSLRWLPNDEPREAIYARLKPLAASPEPSDLRDAALTIIGSLDVAPRETFELLAEMIAQGQAPVACAKSICQISREYWSNERREPVATGLLNYLVSVPLAERTSPDAKLVMRLVKSLAEQLPSDRAAPILRNLEGVTMREFAIRTLIEQMAYDQTVLVVQAGQGVQIRLTNDDIMPHNLVIVDSPAAREEVGIAADRMQNEPDALAKGYVPTSKQILHHTRLLYPQQSDTLTFTAPTTPGTYAYVCTFPGHWIKMYGALQVVDDVGAYLAANQPLPSADDLLGIAKVEWTYERLATELTGLTVGRSFENGHRNFLKASCFSCHLMRGEGGRIGPELTKIHETYKTPEEILRHIIDPSEKVEEKYATTIIEMATGQVLRGVIVGETETELQLNENPLASCEAQVIAKDQIEEVTRSRLSPMPAGLLNTLTKPEEVLDLLAYLISGGDPTHSYFQ